MANYTILAGTTSVSIEVFIFDPATGLPDNTVIHSTAGLVLQYRRKGEANVSIVEASLAALTTAWTDSGFLLIGNGVYRLDLPNLAVAAGAAGVVIHGTLTSRAIVPVFIDLVAYNSQDAVRLGLTALPNVASGSAGAIPTTGTGTNQISVTSGAVVVGDKTGYSISGTKTTLDALNDIAAGDVADVTKSGHATAGTFGASWGALPEATAGEDGGLATYLNIFEFTTRGSVNDGSPSASSFIGNSGLEDTLDNSYTGFLVFTSGVNKGRARPITAYTASTRQITVSPAFPVAPGNGDVFGILGYHGA